MLPLKPIGPRIIVKQKKIENEKKSFLIALDEKPWYHEVVAIGDGECPVKIGDIVKVDDYSPRPFKIPGETGDEYFLIRYEEVLALKTTP